MSVALCLYIKSSKSVKSMGVLIPPGITWLHHEFRGCEDYGIARAYRDTGIPVKLPVYGTGRIPVQERHCGTSEMLVPVEIDLENSTVPVPIPVPVERILLHPP